jgi:predicted transglutaminase-like cysteine proteinase
VNRFFNQRMAWRDDQSVWGQVDYWAAPLEMFGKGAGDCEDLAMGKYFSLLGLGVAESSLRLVYVRAQWEGRPQAHMVLAWYATPDAEPYILDNLNPKLLKASERPDLQPVFSFNAQGLWQGAGAQAAGNPLTRLTIWRDALARAKAEGF